VYTGSIPALASNLFNELTEHRVPFNCKMVCKLAPTGAQSALTR
jgi:hypothetical protein